MLFAEKASESYFVGQLQVARHEAVGGVGFTLTQPRAHVDLGVGYTAAYAAAAMRTPLTDLGNTPQNLYMTRGDPPMVNGDADGFVRDSVNAGSRIRPQGPAPLFGPIMPAAPAGTARGQAAVCEFIATPVSADLAYFRSPCNPAGARQARPTPATASRTPTTSCSTMARATRPTRTAPPLTRGPRSDTRTATGSTTGSTT